jgi:hypothetical protein
MWNRRADFNKEEGMLNDKVRRGKDGHVPSGPEEAALRTRLAGLLPDEEEVHWVGQPRPSRAAWKTVPSSLFGLVVLAMFVWEPWGMPKSAFLEGDSSGFFSGGGGLFGLMRLLDPLFFVLFGLVALGAPFIAHRNARKTLYAVTGKRLLIVQLGRSPVTESFVLPGLTFLECREKKDGTGDLLFSSREESDSEAGTRMVEIGFLGVRDIRTVESLVRSLLESARSSP